MFEIIFAALFLGVAHWSWRTAESQYMPQAKSNYIWCGVGIGWAVECLINLVTKLLV